MLSKSNDIPTQDDQPSKAIHVQSRSSTDRVLMPPPPFLPQHPQSSRPETSSTKGLEKDSVAQRDGATSGYTSSVRQGALPRIIHLRHQSLDDFFKENQRNRVVEEYADALTLWPVGRRVFMGERKTPLDEAHWGSDTEFHNPFKYGPVSTTEISNFMQKEQMRCLQCFDLAGNAIAQASTSTDFRNSAIIKPNNRKVSSKQKTPVPRIIDKTKRLGSNGKDGAEKVPRKKLTEREKKGNHVQSEKKRRESIQKGIDDLRQLVPELRSEKYSKSTMLFIAADWLEELIRGNEELRAQLSALEGQAGGSHGQR
ncbi:hypothetical protein FDECE_16453 [Fusarium decemcellulare]|nr:hypothetical protein FDECE_16453 [Fusarium decemcellulare]